VLEKHLLIANKAQAVLEAQFICLAPFTDHIFLSIYFLKAVFSLCRKAVLEFVVYRCFQGFAPSYLPL
jgi:hypothetical protein